MRGLLARLSIQIPPFARWIAWKVLSRFLFPSHAASLVMLRNRACCLRTIIDVGAFEGEWTSLVRLVFPGARVLMVEAQESKAGALRSLVESGHGDVQLAIAVAGPKDGQSVNFYEMETGSSVLGELSDVSRTVTTAKVRTLDSIVADLPSHWGAPDFIKVDVQGYELEVLRGAEAVLSSARFAMLEVSLIQYNEGAPLLAEVIAFMDDRDFRVVDIFQEMRRRDGQLIQLDVLFERLPSTDEDPLGA
ncbi:FkbM family methyltransferase [Euzebya sp.]|uniref:FkbM family methyltransferase n=1 Tax=Euzebya sp. TaxID=1971409 RepID=UPI003519CB72